MAKWFSSFGAPTALGSDPSELNRQAELEADMKRWGNSDSADLASLESQGEAASRPASVTE